jgi:hypothetical protein
VEVPSLAYNLGGTIILILHIEVSTAATTALVCAATSCRSYTLRTFLEWGVVVIPGITYDFVLAVILCAYIELSSATICT